MLLALAFALAADSAKTFEEKERIARDMKKISKQLNVRCEYCHADAARGLKEGDYTLLTQEGEYAHETMFPISKDFRVECAYCHTGVSELNAAGERSLKDMKFMRRYKREQKKDLTCKSCHIPGERNEEFRRLTRFGKKNR
ncbi:MAG: multiheme c-type cytochrome [Spirochaetota bacterium]